MKTLLDDLKFADEVIIVDSYSKDEAKSIATSFENVNLLNINLKITLLNDTLLSIKPKKNGFYLLMQTSD